MDSGNLDFQKLEYALIFAKKILGNRIFLGHYQERRYVKPLNNYRDVVIIDNEERELKTQLDVVKQHMEMYCGPSVSWIGITGPDVIGAPNGHALWVKLHGMPLGKHWFQIKNIKISQSHEVILSLKRVRKDKDVGDDRNKGRLDGDNQMKSVPSLFAEIFSYGTTKNLISSVTSVLTAENVNRTVCFITVLFITVVVGLLQLTKLLGLYSLKLLQQLTFLLHVLTPYFLSIMDFLSKCVGGFYILIAMIWRERKMPRHRRVQPLSIQF